jgi:transposase
MKITTVGIDLAKNVFQVHAVDERGRVELRRQLRRDQMTAFFANLPPCVIGMEACGSAHHWARTLKGFGHDVRLMSPQFVKPYVKSNKNDIADAEAICEAVARPNMRFVPSRASSSRPFCRCIGSARDSSRRAPRKPTRSAVSWASSA